MLNADMNQILLIGMREYFGRKGGFGFYEMPINELHMNQLKRNIDIIYKPLAKLITI